MKWVLWSSVMLMVLTACGSAPKGHADNREGRAAAAAMCESVRAFSRLPLDPQGLRRAWFLPLGSDSDWGMFYAPMEASPKDAAADAFYLEVAQLTHYLSLRDYADVLAECFDRDQGFERTRLDRSRDMLRVQFRDRSSLRSIAISSTGDTATILVAEDSWRGDVEHALRRDPVTE